MTIGDNGVLQSQPETENSAGIAKLIGRPSASEPNEGLTYTAPAALSPGDGVCKSQPATLNQ